MTRFLPVVFLSLCTSATAQEISPEIQKRRIEVGNAVNRCWGPLTSHDSVPVTIMLLFDKEGRFTGVRGREVYADKPQFLRSFDIAAKATENCTIPPIVDDPTVGKAYTLPIRLSPTVKLAKGEPETEAVSVAEAATRQAIASMATTAPVADAPKNDDEPKWPEPPKPQVKFASTKISALFDKLDPNRRSPNSAVIGEYVKLFQKAVLPCWASTKNPKIVEIAVKLDKKGALAEPPKLLITSNDADYLRSAAAAIDAATKCNLPERTSQFSGSEFDELIVAFDPTTPKKKKKK